MLENKNRIILKAKYSFYSTLIFILFANPETYRVIQLAMGSFVPIVDSYGTPTVSGFFISAFLFFTSMISIMLLN